MVYLDYAAATPMDERVLRAMEPYFHDNFFNPSAPYMAARQVRNDVEDARHRLAKIIGAKPAEIIMTAGATESINLALGGVNSKILTSTIEHQSVIAASNLTTNELIPVNEQGAIDLKALRELLTNDRADDIELVSIGYVNNETGVVQDLSAIAKIIDETRKNRLERGVNRPLLLHSDASQAAGLLDLNVARIGVDLLTLNASKCYGPKQVGLLYIKAGIKLKPLIVGGGQELGLRSGTENVAGIIGFAKALELANKTRASEVKRLNQLRQSLRSYLTEQLPDIEFNEHKKRFSPSILNFSISSVDGERVVFALDQLGIMVATGSACAANKGLRSHTLLAMGFSEERIDGSIRLSFGRFTTKEEIESVKPIIVKTINQQRQFGGLND